MKIVFIITSLVTGGAQIMLLKLLRNLDRSRFTPWVITLTGEEGIGLHIESLGIPVHILRMKPLLSHLGGSQCKGYLRIRRSLLFRAKQIGDRFAH